MSLAPALVLPEGGRGPTGGSGKAAERTVGPGKHPDGYHWPWTPDLPESGSPPSAILAATATRLSLTYSTRRIRTVTPRAPLHKNTVGLLALPPTRGGQAANYANVSVNDPAQSRPIYTIFHRRSVGRLPGTGKGCSRAGRRE